MKRLKFVKKITIFYVNDHRISLITNTAMAGEYKMKQTTEFCFQRMLKKISRETKILK